VCGLAWAALQRRARAHVGVCFALPFHKGCTSFRARSVCIALPHTERTEKGEIDNKKLALRAPIRTPTYSAAAAQPTPSFAAYSAAAAPPTPSFAAPSSSLATCARAALSCAGESAPDS
jgi:hypothetical protein